MKLIIKVKELSKNTKGLDRYSQDKLRNYKTLIKQLKSVFKKMWVTTVSKLRSSDNVSVDEYSTILLVFVLNKFFEGVAGEMTRCLRENENF